MNEHQPSHVGRRCHSPRCHWLEDDSVLISVECGKRYFRMGDYSLSRCRSWFDTLEMIDCRWKENERADSLRLTTTEEDIVGLVVAAAVGTKEGEPMDDDGDDDDSSGSLANQRQKLEKRSEPVLKLQ